MAFVPLHNHSDYSLLDGASQISKIVERACDLGMESIALTDHGVMYGVLDLVKKCKEKGIKPIIGNEMYVINGSIDDPQPKKEKRYHLVVLAKNYTGYKNLVKLTTISHLNGMRGRGIFSRPCIDKSLLSKYSDGLIVSTACLGGEIPQAILKGRLDVAEDIALWYKKLFADDFYLEIQDHGSIEDRIVNVELIKIGKKHQIKVIATNDAHYISNMDVEAHDALLCVQRGACSVRSPRRPGSRLRPATARRGEERSRCTRRICSVCGVVSYCGKVTRYSSIIDRSIATVPSGPSSCARSGVDSAPERLHGFHGGRSPTPSISVCSGSSAPLRPPRGGDARRGGDAPREPPAPRPLPSRPAARSWACSEPLVRMSSSFVAMSASAFCCSDRTPSCSRSFSACASRSRPPSKAGSMIRRCRFQVSPLVPRPNFGGSRMMASYLLPRRPSRATNFIASSAIQRIVRSSRPERDWFSLPKPFDFGLASRWTTSAPAWAQASDIIPV